MKIRNYIFHGFTTIQLGLFAVVLLLENLYGKKMGVSRYIQFKNVEFKHMLFSDAFLKIYSILFIISILFSIFLIFKYSKVKSKSFRFSIFFTLVISIFGIYFTIFKNTDNYQALYFFIIACLVSLILQYVKIIGIFLFKYK